MDDPQLYADSNPFQIRDAKQVLKIYREQMALDDVSDMVLDIGCGTGNVTEKYLAPSLGSFEVLLGVDKSHPMINYAIKNCTHEKIRYDVLDIAGDITEFRDEWGTFTKIFSFYCLHWVKNLKKALMNIQALMRNGGDCLLVFVAQCPVFVMHERMAKMNKWKKYMEDVDDYIPDTQNMAQPSFIFTQMMEHAGITVISCTTLQRSYAFSSTTSLRDSLEAVNPFVKRIPLLERKLFIEDCIKTLAAIKMETGNVNENESRCFTYKLIVAHGVKN